MDYIPRHKVFISYYHHDDQEYKKFLINQYEINPITLKYQSIFEDFSVHENEIDDTNLTDEQIRQEIRDNYINDSTVLVLLCGKNTKKRKFIDWEIQAAMYHNKEYNINSLGILVINLPSISLSSSVLANSSIEKEEMKNISNWIEMPKAIDQIRNKFPYLPERIVENIIKDNVKISIVNWYDFTKNNQTIKLFIDEAYKRKDVNVYDTSAKLRGRNS